MTRLFDNISVGTQLGVHLQATFADFNRMDVAVGYFNLRGWGAFDSLVKEKLAAGAETPVVRTPLGLRDVHLELDRIVDCAFGAEGLCANAEQRKEILFARYTEAVDLRRH